MEDQVAAQQLAELERRFTYHPPTDEQRVRYVALRDAARDLAVLIVRTTPASREQSLALTKVDELVMWANAAIARRET